MHLKYDDSQGYPSYMGHLLLLFREKSLAHFKTAAYYMQFITYCKWTFLARMVIRLARFAPQTLRRIVRLSSDSSSSDAKFDNLAWLRPVPVPFDDAWAQLEAKINSGAAIADNPEVEEILRQLVTGHKPPPPPPRKLKHREETEFYKKLMEENPSIKLHLVVFYQKYFPEIGIRLSGWRKKNRVT